MKYEVVMGLETHVELSTKTKIFCGCTTEFGGDPNTHCCPICIGLPGTMPKLNREVVKYAIMAGLALNCDISKIAKMDRKNYVYPDLPKAYQISEYDRPLCEHGHVDLSSGRQIGITRIHIEEDAGKLVHERGQTFIDYNRGGVALIEIVSEPDFRSVEEVIEYLEYLQLTMRYIGVSDCKMQEGSLRCDVNVSVRPVGYDGFGTRTEIKNMNSFTNISKAVKYEVQRQIDLIESGGKVVQETRRFDDDSGVTESMRGKEDAHDYRYFREPDLVTIFTSAECVEEIKKLLPELPHKKLERYIKNYGLSEIDAKLLVKYKRVADFFENSIKGLKSCRNCANLILSLIFSKFDSEEQKEKFEIKVSSDAMNELLKLLESGKIRNNVAKKTLEEMLKSGKRAGDLLSEDDLKGLSEDDLMAVCAEAVKSNPTAVSDYLNGKQKAVKSLIGFVMKNTKGKADAQLAEKFIVDIINNKN